LAIITINLQRKSMYAFFISLTKPKTSQACKRSNLSWNRPSKVVVSCSILWCWKYDRGGKQCSISVRNENWQSSQSIFRERVCTRFCTTLTKIKFSQACKRSDLSWNRPSKAVIICIFCGVGNTIEVVSNIVSVRNENCQSSRSIF
jgi:hypothetical protein